MPTSEISRPRRSAQPKTESAMRWRRSRIAATRPATHAITIVLPMMLNSVESSGVLTLKWLGTPRTTWPTMIVSSTSSVTAVTQATPRTNRVCPRTNDSSHSSVEQ